jgi:hypothetical protein
MNAFAAAAILSQISLHHFLALHSDQRLQLALPIPECMMVGLNSFLQARDNYLYKQRFNEVIAQRCEDVNSCIGSDDDARNVITFS